jgi:hypothetical protein
MWCACVRFVWKRYMCLNVGLCLCACCLSMVQWLIQLKWNYLYVYIYIYTHTVFDLIWTDQWIEVIESVDVLIQFTPFAHLLCQHYDMLVVPHTPTPSFWCQTLLPCPWYKLKIKSVQVGKTFIPNLFVVCIFSFLKPLGMFCSSTRHLFKFSRTRSWRFNGLPWFHSFDPIPRLHPGDSYNACPTGPSHQWQRWNDGVDSDHQLEGRIDSRLKVLHPSNWANWQVNGVFSGHDVAWRICLLKGNEII